MSQSTEIAQQAQFREYYHVHASNKKKCLAGLD